MPFMVSGGKSLEEIARENEKPNASFFKNFQLPKQILKPEYQSGFGISQVSVRGIQDRNSPR